MKERSFRQTVEEILGENSAVEEFSVGDRHAKAIVNSRKGGAEDDIVTRSVLEGFDAVYRGTDNGRDSYALKDSSPGELPEDPEEVRELASRYRADAESNPEEYVSFGEWNSQ